MSSLGTIWDKRLITPRWRKISKRYNDVIPTIWGVFGKYRNERVKTFWHSTDDFHTIWFDQPPTRKTGDSRLFLQKTLWGEFQVGRYFWESSAEEWAVRR